MVEFANLFEKTKLLIDNADSLSGYLTEEYRQGFSRTNLAGMLVYRDCDEKIVQSLIGQLSIDRQNFPFKLSWTY